MAAFVTPLGVLNFELETGARTLLPIDTIVSDEQCLSLWSSPGNAKVVVFRMETSLKVEARCAVWRMEPLQEVRPVWLKCVWSERRLWTEGGPDNGENLCAQTWTNGFTKVTLGLPEDYEDAIAYRPDGFEIDIRRVPHGHIACAWGADVPGDVASWLAVDVDPAHFRNRLP